MRRELPEGQRSPERSNWRPSSRCLAPRTPRRGRVPSAPSSRPFRPCLSGRGRRQPLGPTPVASSGGAVVSPQRRAFEPLGSSSRRRSRQYATKVPAASHRTPAPPPNFHSRREVATVPSRCLAPPFAPPQQPALCLAAPRQATAWARTRRPRTSVPMGFEASPPAQPAPRNGKAACRSRAPDRPTPAPPKARAAEASVSHP